MKWIDYREQLKIGFHNEKKREYAITNLLTFIKVDMKEVVIDEFLGFVLDTGTAVTDTRCLDEIYQYNINRADFIWDILVDHQKSFEDFLSYFVALMNSWLDKKRRDDYKTFLIQMLENAHLQYELFSDTDGYFIFPKGARELDDALVSQPLEWLKSYPATHTAWIKALKEYASATGENASDIADKFRKALETFFQEFFSGNKSLENFKADYGKYLKDQGIPKEVNGNFETLLQSYTQFMNNYAKHRDATSNKVLEYIMYQTGNIIRLLITLKQEEQTNAD